MYRMMEETSEAEFQRLLDQLRDATPEQPDPEGADADEALLDEDDDDNVVMLEIIPLKNPARQDEAPTPSSSEKVNENIS